MASSFKNVRLFQCLSIYLKSEVIPRVHANTGPHFREQALKLVAGGRVVGLILKLDVDIRH